MSARESPAERLLGAIGPATPRLEWGRPLFRGVALDESGGAPCAVGVLWGLPDAETLRLVRTRLAPNATVALVTSVALEGARGWMSRALLVPSGHTPRELDALCTELFLFGARGLRVFELEPLRHIVAIVGTLADGASSDSTG